MPTFPLIELGATANDSTGDNLRVAGQKVNDVITFVNGNSPSIYSKMSSAVTAAPGQMIFADTSSNAFSVTLPVTPTFGDTVDIVDYAGSFATNNLTVPFVADKINRLNTSLVLATNNQNVKLVYVDPTMGWLLVR